jgi:hypothetical protein
MWSSSGQRFGDVNESTTFEGFSATEEPGLIRGPRPDRFTPVLWFSPDGQRWTGVGLQEAFGVDDFPTEVVVGEDTIILRWSGYSFLRRRRGVRGRLRGVSTRRHLGGSS